MHTGGAKDGGATAHEAAVTLPPDADGRRQALRDEEELLMLEQGMRGMGGAGSQLGASRGGLPSQSETTWGDGLVEIDLLGLGSQSQTTGKPSSGKSVRGRQSHGGAAGEDEGLIEGVMVFNTKQPGAAAALKLMQQSRAAPAAGEEEEDFGPADGSESWAGWDACDVRGSCFSRARMLD